MAAKKRRRRKNGRCETANQAEYGRVRLLTQRLWAVASCHKQEKWTEASVDLEIGVGGDFIGASLFAELRFRILGWGRAFGTRWIGWCCWGMDCNCMMLD